MPVVFPDMMNGIPTGLPPLQQRHLRLGWRARLGLRGVGFANDKPWIGRALEMLRRQKSEPAARARMTIAEMQHHLPLLRKAAGQIGQALFVSEEPNSSARSRVSRRA